MHFLYTSLHICHQCVELPSPPFVNFKFTKGLQHSICFLNIQAEPSVPASLQPLADLSLLPPVDTPEAAFDMIAASNLQAEVTLDPEAEEPAVASDSQDDVSNEPEENVEPAEDTEEEIPLEEVNFQ